MRCTLSDKIIKRCKKYDVISFDIFDTLLKRDVKSPKNVFYIVEKLYKSRVHIDDFSFVDLRMKAEVLAKEKSVFEDVTLEEIYSNLNIDESTKTILQEMELEVEKNLLMANVEVKKVFDYCKSANKKIYIISDMYLPKSFVEAVLAENGYCNYHRLFLSNEYRATKKSGKLFKIFLEEERLKAREVLHIGDSRYSDVLSPKKVGIRGYHINRILFNTVYLRKEKLHDKFELTSWFAFVNNHITMIKDREVRLGFEVLGPILCNYCTWLHDSTEKSNAKIWFAARDMFWFKKAYEILYGKQRNIQDFEYVYISRKSLRPLYTMVMGNILKSGDIFPRDKYSLSQVIRYLGYRVEDIDIPINIDVNEKRFVANKLYEYKELEDVFNTIKVLEEEKRKATVTKRYLEEKGFFSENIILADVGWHGTTQFILQEIKNKLGGQGSIYGYYIGDVEGTQGRVGVGKAHMLYFDENADSIFSKGTMLFESLIAATHGTTRTYEERNGVVEPVLGSTAHVDETIVRIQEGALLFVEEYKKSVLSKIINISPDFSRIAFERLAGAPLNGDLELLGEIVYDDNGHYKLAAPKKFIKYVCHPKEFVHDMKYSPWRIGFMYRLFKVRLPYGRIYKVLRKILGKNV